MNTLIHVMLLVANEIRIIINIHHVLGQCRNFESRKGLVQNFFIPWSQKPYRKITVEDVKYVLSLHYQDTPYDPYGPQGDAMSLRQFRPIGINRTSQTALLQMCPNKI